MESTEKVIASRCVACNAPIGERDHTFYDGCCQSCAYVIAGMVHGEIIEYEIPVGLYEDWQATEYEDDEEE